MMLARRIVLFLALNLIVVLTLSFVLNFLGVQPFLTHYGLDLYSLGAFCLVWGMGGALISLCLSRTLAKWMMKIVLIEDTTTDSSLKKVLDMVRSLTQKAGISMPQVGIYHSPEVNAFATGPTQKKSLVAVSSGLLNRMNEDELRAILGHEISHIANGDMVTMTLLQGVVNAFVMFLARILAYAISMSGKSKTSSRTSNPGSYFLFVYLFEILFMILGSLIVAAYSRYREFRADQGGASLAGKQAMISALQSLRTLSEIKDPQQENSPLAAFKITDSKKKGLIRFFASHPPLEERIARLQTLSYSHLEHV